MLLNITKAGISALSEGRVVCIENLAVSSEGQSDSLWLSTLEVGTGEFAVYQRLRQHGVLQLFAPSKGLGP